jgi:hypothetical protein
MEMNRMELLKLKAPRQDARNDDLIIIIHRVCDYADQIRVLGDAARAEDPLLMGHLRTIIPAQYIPNWELSIATFAARRKPNLLDFADYLDKLMPGIIGNRKAMPFVVRDEVANNQRKKEKKPNNGRSGRSYYTQAKRYKCWYHNSDSHNPTECKTLWMMSGKDVVKIAKEKNICTKCIFIAHNGACQLNDKLFCKLCKSQGSHRFLNCPQREAQSPQQSNENPNKTNNHVKKDKKENAVKQDRPAKVHAHKADTASNSGVAASSSEDDDEEEILAEINAAQQQRDNPQTWAKFTCTPRSHTQHCTRLCC